MRVLAFIFAAFVLLFAGVTAPASAEPSENRIAFVVGNGSYTEGELPTAANDAGLIAQTLQAAGFDVVGARDLDAETLRQSYADFLKKVTDAGPDTVAFVYLSGYGLQYGTENYYVPIGADVSRDTDIPIAAIRLSDLTNPLVAMNLKARFLVFDAAYKVPFTIAGGPLAGGFSLVDASPGSLVAYNAAPGTIAPAATENYGLYAQSLAAMLREGGLPPDEIFDRVRLRVNDQSKGAEVPWDSSKIDMTFRFFDRAKDAPPPAATPEQTAALTTTPIKDLPVKQAYTAAVARDTIESYSQFTAVYGGDPLGKRARALLAVRREAITWRRSAAADTPNAYWSYLSRYPHGSHAGDARLRLQELAAAEAPPADYQALNYDVPPPPPDETTYVDQPAVDFGDSEYADYAPPPPPPVYWLPPVQVGFIDLPPPPPPVGLFFLPVPVFVPLPVYYDPPDYVVYPQDNYFYGGGFPGVPYDRHTHFDNIHRPFPPGGPHIPGNGPQGIGPGHAAVVGAALGAAAVALPAAALARRTALQNHGITTPAQLRTAQSKPGGLKAFTRPASPTGAPVQRNVLPGVGGKALPPVSNVRPVPGVVAGSKPGQPGASAFVKPGQTGSTPSVKPGQPGAAAVKPGQPNAAAVKPGQSVAPGGKALRPGLPASAEKRVVPNAKPTTTVRPTGPVGGGGAAAAGVEHKRAAASAAQTRAADKRNALQQRQATERDQRLQQRSRVKERAVQSRAVQQRAVQQRAVQERVVPRREPQIAPRREAPRPQVQRPAPQVRAPAPQQFRPPPQQVRPPPQAPRSGGFGGGGDRKHH